MSALLYILTMVTLLTSETLYVKNKKLRRWCVWLGAIIITSILVLIGSYSICGDGWQSLSIGRQGACSHHGGVIVRLNIIGWILIIIDSIVIIINLKKIDAMKNRK